ncbi:glycoside hydrolase family protein [Azospirillum doebereinerae]|uniref:Lysozyme n=1 Tax=Azospirillum doebereinerae TaxID=92933 RepID=A0A433JDF0_9PROT|nr:glycoside hydrolase family protein [Azospirillum doebereinerae]MCG5240429.1 glycoside hydrolase family protein [Azospirillum doebereinerae]RUQ74919.1 lysozyme [Azospirillum doebereinerae]
MPDIAKLKADLIRDEDLRLKPYRCTAGKITIGVGRNLDDVGVTKAEALILLDNDVARVTADLDRTLPWWRKLDEPRRRALANMAFNLGIDRLRGFRKMLTALEAGDYARAAAEAQDSLWASQVGGRTARIVQTFRSGV